LPVEPAGATASAPFAAPIRTAWGGLFYLLNVALALELYGDFTTPLLPGLLLPIWDFLALLGRELFGESLQTDPVWRLLAELSGRPDPDSFDDDSPFEPPDEWRLPPAWLAAFPESGVWRYDLAGGRLRVLHPAGFLALDVPFPRPPESVDLAAGLEPYLSVCAFMLEPGPLPPIPAGLPPLRRWAGWLAPYVRARLARALGDAGDPAIALGRHPAWLHLTDTDLDVSLSLDKLPIAIRLAGLDRDPGWVPSAGRVIRFHFT